MRGFLIELARTGGRIAREYFRSHRVRATSKGRSDYVSHVDRMIEDAIIARIHNHYPDHAVVGEERDEDAPARDLQGPCWIIDPIDGTTNFIRGIAHFAISIAFCDSAAEPRIGVVYDPMSDELFIAERGAGLWLGNDRVATSGCARLADALVALAVPFRQLEPLDDALVVLEDLQPACDDVRRSGSAALDLAYVAVGRLDAYFELGIHCWDTAAGELLVRCGGGQATGLDGASGELLARRSILAAATPELHRELGALTGPLASWVGRDPFLPAL